MLLKATNSARSVRYFGLGESATNIVTTTTAVAAVPPGGTGQLNVGGTGIVTATANSPALGRADAWWGLGGSHADGPLVIMETSATLAGAIINPTLTAPNNTIIGLTNTGAAISGYDEHTPIRQYMVDGNTRYLVYGNDGSIWSLDRVSNTGQGLGLFDGNGDIRFNFSYLDSSGAHVNYSNNTANRTQNFNTAANQNSAAPGVLGQKLVDDLAAAFGGSGTGGSGGGLYSGYTAGSPAQAAVTRITDYTTATAGDKTGFTTSIQVGYLTDGGYFNSKI